MEENFEMALIPIIVIDLIQLFFLICLLEKIKRYTSLL